MAMFANNFGAEIDDWLVVGKPALIYQYGLQILHQIPLDWTLY